MVNEACFAFFKSVAISSAAHGERVVTQRREWRKKQRRSARDDIVSRARDGIEMSVKECYEDEHTRLCWLFIVCEYWHKGIIIAPRLYFICPYLGRKRK